MLSRNPATHGQILTGSERSDKSTSQGRDEEQGFPVRTRNWFKKEGEVNLLTGRHCSGGERAKKEAWRGEPMADFTAKLETERLVSNFLMST
jgi:hypothetical protein